VTPAPKALREPFRSPVQWALVRQAGEVLQTQTQSDAVSRGAVSPCASNRGLVIEMPGCREVLVYRKFVGSGRRNSMSALVRLPRLKAIMSASPSRARKMAASGRTPGHNGASIADGSALRQQYQPRALERPTWQCRNLLRDRLHDEGSSETWELQPHPHLWHSRAEGLSTASTGDIWRWVFSRYRFLTPGRFATSFHIGISRIMRAYKSSGPSYCTRIPASSILA
jgi:hypothetical protein